MGVEHPPLRPLRMAVAAIATSAFMLSSIFSPHRADADATKPIRWLFNGPGVAAIASNAEASRVLDGAEPFVMLGPAVQSAPQSWKAVLVASFTNLNALSRALEADRLPEGVSGVMYDNERWKFTPEAEQRGHAGSVKQAADLVHAKGLIFLAAPAVTLVAAMAPDDKGPRYEAYLRLRIAADAARYADVFDIQAQGSESNAALYADFVRRAAAQAREANPKVIVLAGISTQPNGQNVTSYDILRAIAATEDFVDGYWFNIPRPSEYCPRCTQFRPDIAIDVLRRLAAR